MVKLHHNGLEHANTRDNWFGTDSYPQFLKNCSTAETSNQLKNLGWHDKGCINYHFNSHGFRCAEFTQESWGVAVGCSFTLGVGLPVSKTWPSVLTEMLGRPIWNLGVGGAAMDTAFRVIDHYIDMLRPKIVLLLTPPADRFEYFSGSTSRVVLPSNAHNHDPNCIGYIKTYLSSDKNTKINFAKNLLAMQQICHKHETPFVFLDLQDQELDCHARDLLHAGVAWHTQLAAKFHDQITQKGLI